MKREFSMDEMRDILKNILDCAAECDAVGVHRNLQQFRTRRDTEIGYIDRLMTQITPFDETLAEIAKEEMRQRIKNVADHAYTLPISSFVSVTSTTPISRSPPTLLRFIVKCGPVSAAFVPRNSGSQPDTSCSLKLINDKWFATQKNTGAYRDLQDRTVLPTVGSLRLEFLVPITDEEAEIPITDEEAEYLVATQSTGGKRKICKVPDVFHGILCAALQNGNRKGKVTVVAAYATPMDPSEVSPAHLGAELSKFAKRSCPTTKKEIARYCSLVRTTLATPLEFFFKNVIPVE